MRDAVLKDLVRGYVTDDTEGQTRLSGDSSQRRSIALYLHLFADALQVVYDGMQKVEGILAQGVIQFNKRLKREGRKQTIIETRKGEHQL